LGLFLFYNSWELRLSFVSLGIIKKVMTKIQILEELKEAFPEMNLEQAFGVVDRVLSTAEELTEEGHSFDETELIVEIGHFMLFEN